MANIQAPSLPCSNAAAQQLTIELVRKRAEHNEGEISTLEELSLHQEDIEQIEHLQDWCRDLRILLLQSNLIPKIENLNKMKRLEYLNLALNNVERIENLEGCESLEKLDLTLNFVGDLTSISSLKKNVHLQTLYLTGNPCTDFTGYRDYVIATLTQLQTLDSEPIKRSDRIKAMQNYKLISESIQNEQEHYKVKREIQQQENRKRTANMEFAKSEDPEKIKKLWDELCDNSPETRVELANLSRKQKEREGRKEGDVEDIHPKRTVRLFKDDGSPLSVNEPRIPFTLVEDDQTNSLVLTVEVYRHLDTSLVEADVQPSYVRVTIKGKVFQMVLPEEVHSDSSSAKRSQISGHLVITMPMVKEGRHKKTSLPTLQSPKESIPSPAVTINKREFLEIGGIDKSMDFSRITEMKTRNCNSNNLLTTDARARAVNEKAVSENFVENLEVPPLE